MTCLPFVSPGDYLPIVSGEEIKVEGNVIWDSGGIWSQVEVMVVIIGCWGGLRLWRLSSRCWFLVSWSCLIYSYYAVRNLLQIACVWISPTPLCRLSQQLAQTAAKLHLKRCSKISQQTSTLWTPTPWIPSVSDFLTVTARLRLKLALSTAC